MGNLNQEIVAAVTEALHKVDGPEARQRLLDALGERLRQVVEDAAEGIVSDLIDSAPPMLADYRALDALLGLSGPPISGPVPLRVLLQVRGLV
jgi:hypothetical protein